MKQATMQAGSVVTRMRLMTEAAVQATMRYLLEVLPSCTWREAEAVLQAANFKVERPILFNVVRQYGLDNKDAVYTHQTTALETYYRRDKVPGHLLGDAAKEDKRRTTFDLPKERQTERLGDAVKVAMKPAKQLHRTLDTATPVTPDRRPRADGRRVILQPLAVDVNVDSKEWWELLVQRYGKDAPVVSHKNRRGYAVVVLPKGTLVTNGVTYYAVEYGFTYHDVRLCTLRHLGKVLGFAGTKA